MLAIKEISTHWLFLINTSVCRLFMLDVLQISISFLFIFCYLRMNTPGQVKEHVAQARKAQKVWAKSSFKQRRQFLRILLKYIVEHQELICE